jgi:hypothetical protein
MNRAAPNEKGTLLRVPIPKLLLVQQYHDLKAAQPCPDGASSSRILAASASETARSIKAAGRYCAICGVRVNNGNLGGWNGHSALTGPLYCLDCADYESWGP